MKTKYLKENFEPIVKSSKNYTEVLQKMGLGIKGNSRPILKKYVKLYNIDTSHFETYEERYSRTNNKLNEFNCEREKINKASRLQIMYRC